MSLVPAKCPECGGNINIDSTKKAAVCEYCNQPFIVEEAIQNFNTTYNITNNTVNNNEIRANVVNVYENKRSDFEIEAGVLKKYSGSQTKVTIPDGVIAVGNRCFYGMKYLEEVIIPEGVKTINYQAFAFCDSLKKVVIPKTIEIIDPDAFDRYRTIEKIVAPDTIDQNILVNAFPANYSEYLHNRIVELALCDKPYEKWFYDGYTPATLESLEFGWRYINDSDLKKDAVLNNLIIFARGNGCINTNLLCEIIPETINNNPQRLFIYGHYFFIDYSWDTTSISIGYCTECITTTEQLNKYVYSQKIKKGYKICPNCGKKLSWLGKCYYCNK